MQKGLVNIREEVGEILKGSKCKMTNFTDVKEGAVFNPVRTIV